MVQWQCVVEVDQVYRQTRSGCLSEVVRVRRQSDEAEAKVTLRPVDMRSPSDDQEMRASVLCGSALWERLPAEDADTAIWGGATRIGVGANEDRR